MKVANIPHYLLGVSRVLSSNNGLKNWQKPLDFENPGSFIHSKSFQPAFFSSKQRALEEGARA